MTTYETNQRLVELTLSVKTLASNLEIIHEDLRRTIIDQHKIHQRDVDNIVKDVDRVTRGIIENQTEIKRLIEDIRSHGVGVAMRTATPISGIPIMASDASTSPIILTPSLTSSSPVAQPPSVTFKESGDISFTLTPGMWKVIKWGFGLALTASGGAGIWELLKRIF